MEYEKVLIRESNNIEEKEWIKSNIDMKILSNQIKSKRRVTEHGEVLTPRWLVKDMLNMLPKHTQDITVRYLETAAGEGVFLIEVLKRKLETILKKYSKRKDIEFYTLVAISNIYGLELLKDNVERIRENLMYLVQIYFRERFKIPFGNKFKMSLEEIIKLNIINMDSIEYKTPKFLENHYIMRDSDGKIIYEEEFTHITEWLFEKKKRKVKRIDYFYKDIVEEQKQRYVEKNLKNNELINLKEQGVGEINWFGEIDNEKEKKDEIKKAKPIKIFEYVEYLEIREMGDK
ncbi:MAG: hypothetical protein ACRCVJ_14510 [Clostridium sp.]|uniref:hypothetical protein n=1 Tax=Clostridium sp. TaxID=1506 RepID=UPI003F2E8783